MTSSSVSPSWKPTGGSWKPRARAGCGPRRLCKVPGEIFPHPWRAPAELARSLTPSFLLSVCLPATVELSGTRKLMEAEVSRLERDKELLAEKLCQLEQEGQAALRKAQAAHEEDVDRLQREKVRARLYQGPVAPRVPVSRAWKEQPSFCVASQTKGGWK